MAVSSGTLTKNGVPVVANTTTLEPGETIFWTPAADANGTLEAFTVVVSDGGDSSVTPVTVRVETAPVNDRPTLSTITTLTGAVVDTDYTITYEALAAAANETDPDTFGQLSFRFQALVAGTLTKNGTAVVGGTTLIGPGESFVWTPPAGQTGDISAFTVVAWDGSLTSAGTGSVVINISALPTLTTVSPLVGATAGQPHTITYGELLAAANETNAGATPSFRIEAVSNGTLTKNGVAVTPGTTTIASGDSVVWTPTLAANGTIGAFTIVASNGTLFSTTPVSVNVVTVTPENQAPTLTTITPFNGSVDQPVTITYAALLAASNAADPVTGAVLFFKITSIATGSTLTKNGVAVTAGTRLGAGETLVWTPPAQQNGLQDAFFVVATDGVLDSTPEALVSVQIIPTVLE